jgi:hypothetical protein
MRERVSLSHIKHGMSQDGEYAQTYSSWRHMLRRCNNKRSIKYSDYGGRGIRVCDRWQGHHGFENFLVDMGKRPENMTLDRKDNNGNYEPGNCRWATREEQANNTRRNRYIEFRGEYKTLSEWARFLGLDEKNVRLLLKNNKENNTHESRAQ